MVAPRSAGRVGWWGVVCVCSLRTQQGVLFSQCQLFGFGSRAAILLWGCGGIPLAICDLSCVGGLLLSGFALRVFVGEFDPGSGRTLAACLTHASRAERLFREYSSGERVSNT